MKTFEHKMFYPLLFVLASNAAERMEIPYLPEVLSILGLAWFISVVLGYLKPSQLELMSQLEDCKMRRVYSQYRLAHLEPGDNAEFYRRMADACLIRIIELENKIAQMDEVEVVADDK